MHRLSPPFFHSLCTRGATVVGAFLLAVTPQRPATADVVILQDGRSYSGVIEHYTTEAVRLFDGNLRRVLAFASIQRVVQERPDTSWILVGDRMLKQKDWQTAAEAYRKALEATTRLEGEAQPAVPLERLANLRAHRFHIPGAEKALSLLDSEQYRAAAEELAPFALKSAGAAERHYWLDRLARAYAGLAGEKPTTAPGEVNACLVFALAIAPDCGPARTALAEHLMRAGFAEAAREELLVALDLDPTDRRAQERLSELGVEWRYAAHPTQSSSLLLWAQRRPPLQPSGAAPLTSGTIAAAVRGMRGDGRPARLLLAAYLLDPTVAIANQGNLPYSEFEPVVSEVFKETAEAKGTTDYDKAIIGAAVKVRIDPRFVRALAKVLSGIEPDHVSPDGKRGLIPLSRRQWEIAARYAKVDWKFDEDANEAEKNVELACQYLEWLRREALAPWVGARLELLERIN